VAVLLFQAINGVIVDTFKLEESLVWAFCHLLIWFIVTQIALAFISGAVEKPWEKSEDRRKIDEFGPDVKDLECALRKVLVEEKALPDHVLKEDDPSIHLLEYIRDNVTKAFERLPTTDADREDFARNFIKEQAVHVMEHALKVREHELTRIKLNLKCYAVLCGHITGFAGINCWSLVQQALGKLAVGEHGKGEEEEESVPRTAITLLTSFAVIPCAFLFFRVLFMVSDKFREYVAKGDDGEEDENEKVWDEETEETEDDVIGLTCSFVAAQAITMAITGRMPNAEGESEDLRLYYMSLELLLCAVVMIGVIVLQMLLFGRRASQTEDQENAEEPRLPGQLRNVNMMVFAWCLYFAVGWINAKAWCPDTCDDLDCCKDHKVNEMMTQVCTAIMVSTVALTLIWVLDKIQDNMKAKTENAASQKETSKVMNNMISALAILVGFGWEKTFDMGVAKLVTTVAFFPRPSYGKLALAILLCSVVLPAWKKFILPTIMGYEEEEEKEAEEEEASKEAGLNDPLLRRPETKKLTKKETKAALAKRIEELQGNLDSATKEYKEHSRSHEGVKERVKGLESENLKLEDTINHLHVEIQQLEIIANHIEARR
jgi:hypothetical protein